MIALIFSSIVKVVSNTRPKCFCHETCWTAILLKKIGGCTTFFTLQVKITFYACLDVSGLKPIFHWKGHSVILSESSQSCLAVAFGTFAIVNKEVSSRLIPLDTNKEMPLIQHYIKLNTEKLSTRN